ncbi:MAG: anthranilate synthase component I family protein [Campylobacter sp.]|nr:anthranilate synthase component I family protein [Campylobacter sp.]
MILIEPTTCYKEILSLYPNSYLAEDERQIIIGINCDYKQGDDIDELKKWFEARKELNSDKFLPDYAGIFGVLSYDIVYKFEDIGSPKKELYKFPNFYYADAKNYLHYDKISKIYTFYGKEVEIYNNLRNLSPQKESEKSFYYKTITDLDAEKKHFLKIVQEAKKYIQNGDIFQVVLSEILNIETNLDSFNFYEHLKINNPSPYMFHFPTKYGVIVGSSPELVMNIKNSEILVAPIAGTRARGKDANEDRALKDDLLSDEKELAEHRMLIDLARNDISKFAEPFSIRVKNPLTVTFYESVMHIVSEVYGKKERGVSAFECIKSIFPAGTLSGTPKIRAMEIINELERSCRGVYGGGLGFWHFNADAQISILIRSAIFIPQDESLNSVFIGAGAGIVYDSNPQNEYDEICNKRNSCVKVIKELCKEKK